MTFEEFVGKQNWIWAKTYADKAPHEYIVRGEINGTDNDFVDCVNFIREHGFTAEFWRMKHIYFFFDGKFYWTMGSPIEQTTIINRCNQEDYVIYMKALV